MRTGGKIGRPSKGPRDVILFKVSPEIKQAGQERAQSLGMTLTDYLTSLMSRDINAALPQRGLPFDAVA